MNIAKTWCSLPSCTLFTGAVRRCDLCLMVHLTQDQHCACRHRAVARLLKSRPMCCRMLPPRCHLGASQAACIPRTPVSITAFPRATQPDTARTQYASERVAIHARELAAKQQLIQARWSKQAKQTRCTNGATLVAAAGCTALLPAALITTCTLT